MAKRSRLAVLEVGGTAVKAGHSARIDIRVARLFTGTWVSLPVLVLHGREHGPRLWLSATIHGDELNGMEIVRRVVQQIDPAYLRGVVIAVPVVNVFGFLQQDRYLPDRRDLNRSFPGSRTGSLAGRLAHLLMTEVVSRCNFGIDFHTGSQHRDNLPQIRAQLEDPETRRLAEAFAAPATFQTPPARGTLRWAAQRRDIPTLLFEGGEPLRFNEEAISAGTEGTLRVLDALGMWRLEAPAAPPTSFLAGERRWVRAGRSGIFHPQVGLGERVESAESIGLIASDVFGKRARPVAAPFAGIVIGLTRIPLVNRGDALVHLAEEAPAGWT